MTYQNLLLKRNRTKTSSNNNLDGYKIKKNPSENNITEYNHHRSMQNMA
jgi:hypothetical protein